jgi:hypothetical protein
MVFSPQKCIQKEQRNFYPRHRSQIKEQKHMTPTKDEALDLALEALEPFSTPNWAGTGVDKANAAVTAIRQVRSAPVQPIGYEKYAAIREGHRNASEEAYFAARPDLPLTTAMLKLFRDGFDRGYDTTPPAAQRQWVGLTEQEAAECWSTIAVRTWQAIEAKLKEKNNGGPQPRESP